MPGFLTPPDLEKLHKALAPQLPLIDWAKTSLLASRGAIVICNGQVARVPTIVPARSEITDFCVFLEHNRCSIHKIAPFGCAYFDDHQTKAEGDSRVAFGVRLVIETWRDRTSYAIVWEALNRDGLIAVPPEQARRALKTLG